MYFDKQWESLIERMQDQWGEIFCASFLLHRDDKKLLGWVQVGSDPIAKTTEKE